MFDNLSQEIREIIFTRVRYMDLFETARVSQEWWTLTMASFERFLHKKDDFLLDQVDFCNQMMPKAEAWQWWMLMEFTKSKRLYLGIRDFHALVSNGKGRLIRYFSSKQILVKHLRVDKGESNNAVLRTLPNLNEIFPSLTSLEVNGIAQDSTIFLPSLISLRFGLARMSSRLIIEMTTSELQVLDLKACGLRSLELLDSLKFDNLTRLSVCSSRLFGSNVTHIERILKKIFHESKTLKSVSIHYAYITEQWLQMFPSNVVKIELFAPDLSQDLVKAFGNNVFYERLLLTYVCEDWTSVVKFKTYAMSWATKQAVDNNEGSGDNRFFAYQVNYTCKPTANEESVLVKYSKVAINELISKNNQGLVLTALTYFGHSYTFPIPSNVRNLKFLSDCDNPNDENFELVLEDPTALEVLIGCRMGRLATFPSLINLRELEIIECDKNLLVSILRSCTSLSKLTLLSPDSAVFGKISSNIKSVSLKELTIIGSSDTFEDIMKHFPSLNSLILEKHCTESLLESEVNAIKRLRYLKVIMQGNKELAVHLSTLEFPYMLFGYYRSSHYFDSSKGMELLNEISREASSNNTVEARRWFVIYTERNNMVKAGRSFVLETRCSHVSDEEGSLVYTKNIPTRFLRNTCQVVPTVQDFVDKL